MLTPEERQTQIEKIRDLPAQLRSLVANLSAEELTTHYLADEWTVAQNVHHLADAHMNSFVLFKRILSADRPPVQGYDPDAWADMADANHADIELSLRILDSLHARWTQLLTSLSDDSLARTGVFARVGINSQGDERSIDDYIRIYGNHGEAHLDQIERTLAAK